MTRQQAVGSGTPSAVLAAWQYYEVIVLAIVVLASYKMVYLGHEHDSGTPTD